MVVETGAIARPALQVVGNAVRWTGFGVDALLLGQELQMWKEMLLDVNNGLPPTSTITSPQSEPGLLEGKWWRDKRYIVSKICGNPPYTIPEICQ
jgi:hypothetical protein